MASQSVGAVGTVVRIVGVRIVGVRIVGVRIVKRVEAVRVRQTTRPDKKRERTKC